MRHCQTALSSYKVPSRILIVSEMPTTGSGKILKTELRKKYMSSKGEVEASPSSFSLKDCEGVLDSAAPESAGGEGSITLVECETESELAQVLELLSNSDVAEGSIICYLRGVEFQTGFSEVAALGHVISKHLVEGSEQEGSSSEKLNSLKNMLMECISSSIDIEDASQSVWDAGMTSMLAVRVSNDLEKALSFELPATLLFDYTSVDQIYDFVSAQTSEEDVPAIADVEAKVVKRTISSSMQENMSQVLSKAVQDCLGLIDISLDESLWDLGLTSSTAVALATSIQESLDVDVSATVAFDYPSISALSNHLLSLTSPAKSIHAAQETSAHIVVERKDEHMTLPLAYSFATGQKVIVNKLDILSKNCDAITVVPHRAWSSEFLTKSYSSVPRFGNFMEDVYCFDRHLYNISATEANMMDPQQRMLIQHATNVLYDMNEDSLSQCSCFIGISQMDHFAMTKLLVPKVDAYMGTGNAHSVVAHHVVHAALESPAHTHTASMSA